MNFRRLHTWTFATIPLLGILALYTAAALPTPLTIAALALLLLGLAMPEDARARVPPALVSAMPLVLAAAAAIAIARDGEPVVVAVEFSVALLLIRVVTRSGATHDPQIFVLSLLHLVAAAVLGGNLAFGACLGAFVFVAPAALTLSHLRREVEKNYEAGAKDRAGRRVDVERILRSQRVVEPRWVLRSLLIAPFVVAFTAALFLVVPRVGLAVFLLKPAAGTRMVGFSDSVDLGSIGSLERNEALAARVEWTPPEGIPAPPTLPFFLRGTAFDAYDGRAWKKTDASAGEAIAITRSAVTVTLGPRPTHAATLRLHLEPLDPTIVFLPSGARALIFEPTADGQEDVLVHAGPEGEWRYEARQPLPLRYAVTVDADASGRVETLPSTERSRYLQMPATVDPRLPELAHTLTRGADTPRRRAQAIATHLREEFAYSTNAPSAGTADPIAHFLFVSRAGHCEFFSTALALLLRAEGIPARNVTGFAGAQRNAFGGYYSVRQQNAHSWVEFWNPLGDNAGRWETLDATPVAIRETPKTPRQRVQELYEAVANRWDRHVAAFDLADQAHLAQEVARPMDRAFTSLKRALRSRGLGLAVAVATAGAVFALWRAAKTRTPLAPHRTQSPRRAELDQLVDAIERALLPFGQRATHETLRAYVDRVAPPTLRPRYNAALRTYEGVRYGDDAPSRETLAALVRAMKAVDTRSAGATDAGA
jgi:transglutaminase-like putative cysteine protease